METNVKNYLVKLLANTSFSAERVVNVIDKLGDTDNTMRLISYLTGETDKPKPKETFTRDDKNLICTGYDVISNKVSYEGTDADIRYFSETDTLPSSDDVFDSDYNLPGKYREDSTHTIAVKVKYRIKNSMYYDIWQGK